MLHGLTESRRKADVLRLQVIAVLERQTKGSGHSHSPEVVSSIATQVRDMSARLERTSRELLSLHDRKAAMVDAAPRAAPAKASTTTTLQRDLEWLRQDRVEMTHVRD